MYRPLSSNNAVIPSVSDPNQQCAQSPVVRHDVFAGSCVQCASCQFHSPNEYPTKKTTATNPLLCLDHGGSLGDSPFLFRGLVLLWLPALSLGTNSGHAGMKLTTPSTIQPLVKTHLFIVMWCNHCESYIDVVMIPRCGMSNSSSQRCSLDLRPSKHRLLELRRLSPRQDKPGGGFNCCSMYDLSRSFRFVPTSTMNEDSRLSLLSSDYRFYSPTRSASAEAI